MLRVIDYFEYVTQKGDTWDSIALDQMGDEMYMSDLIQYNPDYADTLIFDAGITINIPELDADDETSDSLPPWRSGDDGDNADQSDNGQDAFDYEEGDPDEEEAESL